MNAFRQVASLFTLTFALTLPVGCGDDDASGAPDAGGGFDAGADAGPPACATGMTDWAFEDAGVEGESPPFPAAMEGADGGAPPFLWGTATAPHQVEGGNTASDWYLFEQMEGRIANGDRSDDGPDHWTHYAEDIARMQADGLNAYRMGIEWAKVFPTRESFETMTPDAAVVAHYHDVLAALEAAGIEPMVTLHHFVSPAWWLDPTLPREQIETMGFASPTAPDDFERWATFVAEEFGAEVDLWITINEPMVLILGGYLVGQFSPGLVYDPSSDLMLRVARGEIFAHAAAYDALHASDTVDADGDGRAALVSIAKHQRVFFPDRPCSERDVAAAARIEYLNNDIFTNAITRGDLDANADGDYDDEGDARAHADLVGRADFLGINYYGITLVNSTVSLGDLIPGLPSLEDSRTPLPKSDLDWAIYPAGLRTVLTEAWEDYGLPIYVTENGIADQGDTMRSTFLVEHLHVLAQTIAAGVDVRGYFHWSTMDNFEWAEGYCPRFGLYRVDYTSPDRTRTPTEAVAVYSRIIEEGRVAADLVETHATYGPRTLCE